MKDIELGAEIFGVTDVDEVEASVVGRRSCRKDLGTWVSGIFAV